MTENTIPQSGSTISLTDFYTKLEQTDWTYEMSDDHSVWRRGAAAMGEIERLAKTSDAHQKLFEAYRQYVWSDWIRNDDGTPNYDAGKQIPKPERPKDNAFRTGENTNG